jgi:hypothetical protein
MNSKLPLLQTLLFTIVLFSCSPDESTNIQIENTNQFTFNGEDYNLITVIINDENTTTNDPSEIIGISLFNKTSSEVTSNGDLSDVTFVYFGVEDINLQATTYNEITDYDISINGSVTNSEFNAGTVLLSDSDPQSDVYAQSGSVTITNFTDFNIDFTFTFTRNDGEVITGRYNGNYLAPN